jgi:hypothetical protein
MTNDSQGEVGWSMCLLDSASKGKSGRMIPLSEEVRDALIEYRNEVNSFAGKTSPHAMVNMFQRWYRHLGFVGCSSRSGRRTFITNAARKISTMRISDPCSLGQSRPAAQLSVGRSRVSNGVTKRYEGLGSSALSRPLRDESEVNSRRSTELREGPGEYPPGSVPSAMRHFLPVVHEPVPVVPTSAAFRDAVHVFSDNCRRA